LTVLLRRLRRLVGQGLERTHALWPDIRRAYGWVHRAARILTNEAGRDAERVARRYDGLTAAVARHRGRAGALAGAIDHFLKVTRSDRPGLFAGYRVPGLPRTNNDLEHCFGAHRHHERRATGRKAASPAAVLRGSVRLIAAAATRVRPVAARDLARADRAEWVGLRRRLDDRRHARTLGTRFRRDPRTYLSQLEARFLQQALPA
jgi:hypothetical protein